MLATLTSKGQLTLPKEIRERLGLTTGSRLDFNIDDKGMIVARPVATTALGLAGLLRRPGAKAMSLRAIDEAVEATAAELNPPAKARKPR
jgi:antitoxin PrlF